jgi:hypothetical protein
MFFALALCATLTATAWAEPVENPQYTHWSQFGVGSFAKSAGTSSASGFETTMTMTVTLVELSDEQAVIERSVAVEMAGQTMETPAQTEVVPAMIEEADVEDFNNPEGKVDEGDEELEVAGQTIQTHWIEIDTSTTDPENAEGAAHGKTWLSEQVPGMLVKMDMTTTGANPTSMQMEVTEFEAK